MRDFQAAFSFNAREAGIGAAPRVIAADVELLYVHAAMRWKLTQLEMGLHPVAGSIHAYAEVPRYSSNTRGRPHE